MDFFTKQFTPLNFFDVWRYIKGYVDYENSTELGKDDTKCEWPLSVPSLPQREKDMQRQSIERQAWQY